MTPNWRSARPRRAVGHRPVGPIGLLRACSACAGDYEDPERTAPSDHFTDPPQLADDEEPDEVAGPQDAVDEA